MFLRRAVGAFLLIVAAGSVLAQETIPPPVPDSVAPPPRPGPDTNAPTATAPVPPGTRRERLRALGGQLFDALVNPAPGSNPAAPGPLDFGRINEVIPKLLAPALAGNSAVESFNLQFDPAATNLALDRARAVADVVFRRTGWSSQPSSAHLVLTTAADFAGPSAPRAHVEAQLGMQTAVAPLIDYALRRWVAKHQPPAGGPASADDFFAAALAEKLARTPKIASLEDVADMYQYLAALRFLAQNDEIDRLRTMLAAAPDEPSRSRLAAELTSARQKRDQLAGGAQTQIERDATGAVQSITLSYQNIPVGQGAAVLSRIDVRLTQGDLGASVTGDIVKGLEVYALVKPVILLTLERLQMRDPATIERQRVFVQGLLAQALGYVVGGNP